MSLTSQKLYDVGAFRLIPDERLLLRDGQPVSVPPKAYDLLLVLVTQAGHLVTKEQLLKEVWPETFVEEANLSYTVSLLRKALGDESEPYRYIETVPKRGYRFKAAVVAPAAAISAETAQESRRRMRPLPLLGVAIGISLLATALVMSLRERGAQPRLARLQLVPPQGVTVENAQISPDGRRVAFGGREGESRKLWVQALDSTTAAPVQGIEGVNNVFWAPDSKRLAVTVTFQGALKTVDLARGTVQTLCNEAVIEGSWSRDGVILFSSQLAAGHLLQVSASGGVPRPATKIDAAKRELRHSSPHFLPDGQHFLFVVHSAEARWSGLYVGRLGSAETKRLLGSETAAVYSAPGYLLHSRDGAIVAQRFDVAKQELSGEPIPIAHDAEYQALVGTPQFSTSTRTVPGFSNLYLISLLGATIFSTAENGLLAYSLLEPTLYQFSWFDRRGTALGDVGSPAPFRTFDLSNDGKRLVVARAHIDRTNLWIFDLNRNIGSRITFERTFQFDPRWGADGRRILATEKADGAQRRIVEIDADGRASVLFEPGFVDDWSRDGRFLLLRGVGPLAGRLSALPLFGDRTPILVRKALLGAPDQATFSPDGSLIAYHAGPRPTTAGVR